MNKTFTPNMCNRNRFFKLAGALVAGLWSTIAVGQYCAPQYGSGCTFGDQITDFSTTGGITNITNNGTACSAGNYSYINTQTVTAAAGTSFNFSVTSGPIYNQGQRIWVDWNNDQDFSDPGEDVWSSTTWTNVAQTGTISVPVTVPGGTYRMRVRCNYNSLVTDPCALQTYGEVEDYDLTVPAPVANDAGLTAIVSPAIVTCALDTNIIVDLSCFGTDTLTSATLNWSLNGVAQTTSSWTGNLGQGQTDNNVLVASNVTYSIGDIIQIWTTMPNGVPDSANLNDTVSIVVPPLSLNGTYTINSAMATGGVNFNSFTDAVAALNLVGVCGPVVINAADGTYSEQIQMAEITGADSTNTIEFRGNNTSNSLVNLTYGSFSFNDNYTLKFDGTDYVSFKDMTIAGSGATYTRVLDINGGATHNTFENIIFSGDLATTSTTFDKIVIYSNNGLDDYNTFANNEIRGGSYGMYWYGSSTTNLEENTVIEGNLFTRQYYTGFRSWYHSNMKFRNNVFSTLSAYNFTSYAFYFYYCDNAFEATGNRVESNNQVPTYGIYAVNCDGTSTMQGLIANNAISVGDSSTTNSQYGIYMSNSGYQNVVHNSIAVFGTSTLGRGLFIPSGGANKVLNNSIANFGNGYATYISNSFAVIQMDNNVQYSLGSNLAFFNGNQTTFADWQTNSGFDLNGYNVDPMYYNPLGNDLHVCSSDLDGTGADLNSLIMEDFDGEMRNTTSPDIGADEFTSLGNFSFGSDTATLCMGDSITLNGVPGAQNIWSTTDSTMSIVVSTTGIWSVDITNGCGTVSDTVETQLNTPATLAATENICANQSTTLDPGVANGTYSWSSSETTQSISVSGPGSFSVMVTDAFGCTSTANTVITQSEETEIQNDTTICTGDQLVLDAGIPGSTYNWTPTGSGQTITVNAPGTYGVTVTDQFNCISTDQMVLTTQDAAVAGFSGVTSFLTGSFSNTSTNATSYNWNFDDGTTSSDENPVHVFPASGTYNVMLVASNFCGSDTSYLTVSTSVTGIQELNAHTSISVYPNPTDGQFNLVVDAGQSANFSVEVTDLQGRVVYQQDLGQILGNQKQVINLADVASGIYLVKVKSGNEQVIQKLSVH